MEEAGSQLRAVVPPQSHQHFLPSTLPAHETTTTTTTTTTSVPLLGADTTTLQQTASTALLLSSYPTSDSATMAALAEVADRAVNCVEIKEYLWQNSSDLTSLPSTMGVFAVIYTLIITWVLAQGLVGERAEGAWIPSGR